MSFEEPMARDALRLTPRHYFWIVTLFSAVVLVAVVINRVSGGSEAASQANLAAPQLPGASAALAQEGPQWQELTVAQQAILRPLANTWNSLAYSHKNKWIALAANYPSRTPEDQAKMQSRMVEWSALTPAERERARLNFAATKKLSASARAAEWAAYQELSPEEKQLLAEKKKSKPIGAAVAVSPTASDKLTAVALTRRTTQSQDPSTVVKAQIDPNTLLPKPIAPAASASASAPTDSQAAPADERSVPLITSDTLSPN